jgi:hypothetical protein
MVKNERKETRFASVNVVSGVELYRKMEGKVSKLNHKITSIPCSRMCEISEMQNDKCGKTLFGLFR